MMANNCSREVVALATGPNSIGRRFSGFSINGLYIFHAKEHEKNRKCQNSGIMVEADGLTYYGRLLDIIERDYYGRYSIILFQCDWNNVKSPGGLKRDSNGMILVNFSKLIHTGERLSDDPFVFSSQVKQVFYVQDPKNADCNLVVEMKPRDTYDMEETGDSGDDDSRRVCLILLC